MVQLLLVFLTLTAHAQFFGLGSGNKFGSRIPDLTEKLRKMPMSASPVFEESFNKAVKEIENTVEEEKLYCAGEAGDSSGKVVPPAQKELCFRELRKHYLDSMNTIFGVKKQYLGVLHTQQVERLEEIRKKLTSEIEKNF